MPRPEKDPNKQHRAHFPQVITCPDWTSPKPTLCAFLQSQFSHSWADCYPVPLPCAHTLFQCPWHTDTLMRTLAYMSVSPEPSRGKYSFTHSKTLSIDTQALLSAPLMNEKEEKKDKSESTTAPAPARAQKHLCRSTPPSRPALQVSTLSPSKTRTTPPMSFRDCLLWADSQPHGVVQHWDINASGVLLEGSRGDRPSNPQASLKSVFCFP